MIINMKFIRSIVLALTSLTVGGRCFVLHQNETDVKSKIEGGCKLSIKDAPYQVYLKDKTYFCGGALIEPNIVLTAAHCVLEYLKTPKKLSVVAGTGTTKLNLGHSLRDKSIEISAEMIKVHHKFTQMSIALIPFDLAVIKLAKKFPKTRRIKPINLSKEDVQINDELIVTGIGMQKPDIYQVSSCLKCYKPKVIDSSIVCDDNLTNCEKSMEALFYHQDESGSRTRMGDSGGPVVNKKNELVGIHTSSVLSDKCQRATSVYHYREWIHDTINELLSNEVSGSSFFSCG